MNMPTCIERPKRTGARAALRSWTALPVFLCRAGNVPPVALAVGMLLACGGSPAKAADHPSRGLWVGQVTVNKVTEVVVGIDAANNIVAPDPEMPTPTPDRAHLRVLLHVDGNGLVRLLKGVALLPRTDQPSPDGQVVPGSEVLPDTGVSLTDDDIALVTDESLFADFSSLGLRIASAAFDFGEGSAAAVLMQLADTAAQTASDAAIAGDAQATIASETSTATQAVVNGADLDAFYSQFLSGTLFTDAITAAADAASIAAITRRNDGDTPSEVLAAAQTAAATATEVSRVMDDATTRQEDSILPDERYVAAVEALVTAAATGAAETASAAAMIPLDSDDEDAVSQAAAAAALAAATAAAGATSPVSAQYNDFIATATLADAAADVTAAAVAAAVEAGANNLLPEALRNQVGSAALKEVAGAVRVADNIIVNEVLLAGELAAGRTVEGSIYLGAFHPTNPFRHFLHPDHSEGFPISRKLTFIVGTPGGADPFERGGFGVDRLEGIYKEELSGLHKPLGPNRDIGLRAEGTFELSRITLVDTLNQ